MGKLLARLHEWWFRENHKLLTKKVADGKASDHEVSLLSAWDKQRGPVEVSSDRN